MDPLPGFDSHPLTEHFPNGTARLCRDLSYTDIVGQTHTVRAGFVTDGASIPRLFWRVVNHPYAGRILPGAILHDDGCARARLLMDSGQITRASAVRLEADQLFAETLRRAGLPMAKVRAMYWEVRIGAHASGVG